MIGYMALGFVIGFSAAVGLYLLVYWYYALVSEAIRRALR